jgi:hypothetical protein
LIDGLVDQLKVSFSPRRAQEKREKEKAQKQEKAQRRQ